ncbi:MAG TPA: DMT family transporter [Solirubrobacterales bacterium]|nr:DMT family transporter [Solirubrobacterales bacterium]
MGALLLAFASSISWGVADFLGGLKARQLPVLNVVTASQLTGLLLVGIYMLIRWEPMPGGDFVLWAPLSGLAGAIGLLAFYRGLAVGNMGVVAPISATAAVVPVVVGIASGDRPSELQYTGLVLALAGVVLASREEVSGGPARGAGLAIVSALGFGFFFVGLDHASDADVGWAILANRVTSFSLLFAAFLVIRPPLAVRRADVPVLALIGTLDITANLMFAIASTIGLVSLVSVLGSLYPLTTAALAAVVLRERPHRVALIGVAMAIGGVVLIAGG